MNSSDLTSVVPSTLREVLPGIFYADRPFVFFDRGIVDFLKGRASATASRRARVCAHPSAEADQHDMLIVSHRDTYVAPHRHLSKSESMLVLEGSASALLFSEDGAGVQYLPMGAPGADRVFFYRMPERQYHSLAIEPWAPAAGDVVAGRAFLAALPGHEARDRARG
jgi:cupin fold WbuC family metalloprotein